MPQLHLHLIPTPGAKSEFLATVETPQDTTASLPSIITLEGYTRDAWAWKPNPAWTSAEVTPATPKAKEKLSGFLKYLKERQKCAYGRFSPTAVLVVSYIQSANKITCKFTLDATQIPNCMIVKKKNQENGKSAAAVAQSRTKPAQQRPQQSQSAAAPSSSRKKSGILGNLLGAQQRTEHHMDVTYVKKPKPQADASTTASSSSDLTTAQQVLQKFRQDMEQKMLDFDLEPDNQIQVKISLAEVTKDMPAGPEKTKVTMDVLKYIVYEQAEEVNEEWVGVKEPSEFMDEITISVYKEAPPEVLEEVNKAELPEEMRGQQRFIQEERQKAVARQEALAEQERLALATAEDEDLATLNVNKRDRRSIEEIQREMNDPKRARTQES